MSSLLVTYKTEEGARTALVVKEGRKFLHVVTMDTYPLRVRKVPLKEGKYMRVIGFPIKRALQTYRALASRDYGKLRFAPQALQEALKF